MSFSSAGYQLLPVLPELVLALGAMVLLMLGAYRGQQTTGLVTVLAVCLLAVTGVLELTLPAGRLTTFGGSFIVDDFARYMKIAALIGASRGWKRITVRASPPTSSRTESASILSFPPLFPTNAARMLSSISARSIRTWSKKYST